MKCVIPEIAYHNRDPVLSLDFQLKRTCDSDPVRLATAGSDSHVVIWEVKEGEEGKVELDCLCDLIRHQRAVNIVRWSPDGSLLASGDDESVIILWQLKQGSGEGGGLFDDGGSENRENWVVYKMLRFHLDDVYDLSWSPCSQFLLSGSVDNSAIISNVHKSQKVGHLSDSRGFVQGVAWNPKHPVLATLSSDRSCRFYDTKTKKLVGKTYKTNISQLTDRRNKKKKKTATTEPAEHKDQGRGEEGGGSGESCAKKSEQSEKSVRLFHDDTFKGFFRRLSWSNDGEILVAPSGVIETDTEAKFTHCTYVFSRCDLSKPAVSLPSKEKYTIAVRFSPLLYSLRPVKRKMAAQGGDKPWQIYQTLFALPYRMVYAVATQNAVMLYDTQQVSPFGRVSNIHYTGLTDLSWSPDGKILFVSSSDGFCSIISFADGEIGEVYRPDTATITTTDSLPAAVTPHGKAGGVGVVAGEKAGGVGVVEGMNEEGVKSPAHIHIKSNKEGGKSNPKRLQFITLSSPKADKKRPVAEAIPVVEGQGSGEEGEEGVEVMDTSCGDLELVLEETQPEAPLEKKRVPLISLPTPTLNSTTQPSSTVNLSQEDESNKSNGGDTNKGRRVSLITLSSPKPKSKH